MQLYNVNIVAKFIVAGVKRSDMSRLHCHVPMATSIPSLAVLSSDTKRGQLISKTTMRRCGSDIGKAFFFLHTYFYRVLFVCLHYK